MSCWWCCWRCCCLGYCCCCCCVILTVAVDGGNVAVVGAIGVVGVVGGARGSVVVGRVAGGVKDLLSALLWLRWEHVLVGAVVKMGTRFC